MKKNIFKTFALIAISLNLLFSSCAKKVENVEMTSEQEPDTTEPVSQEKISNPTFGGTINLAMNKPATLNILDNKIRDVADVLSLVYEPLFVLDENEKPIGVLAKSYEYDESGRGLTVSLIDNVKFHNDIPFTAADVKYTIDYIKTHPESPYNFYVLPIKRVSIIDDFTLKFYYDEPYAYAVSDLIFPIVSADYILSGNYDLNIPIGTGPYEYKDFQSSSHLDLTLFKEYRDKCYVENIHSTIVNDSSDIENMFKAGLIDIYAPMVFNWLDYSLENTNFLEEYSSRNLSFIGFNFAKKDILTKDVRLAIMQSINREELAYKHFVNKVNVSNTPIIPDAYFNSDDEVEFNYSDDLSPIASAESPQKFKMLVNSSSENNIKIAESIANDLKKLNIKLENTLLEKEAYLEKLSSGDFDLYLANVKLSSRPDYYALLSTKGSQNFGKYSNPIMDDYISKLINTTGEDGIKEAVKSIESQFLNDLPYVCLFFHNSAVMRSDNVKGDYVVYKDNLLYGIRGLYMSEE